MLEKKSGHLADNLRQLRDIRQMTQQQLSKLSGVPRPTIAHLESGGANPTLAVLLKVGIALSVSLEELLAPPRAQARLYTKDQLTVRERGRVSVSELLPDPLPGMSIERMTFGPGSHLTGVPHTPGTREYLTCEQGSLELVASGDRFTLAPGDVVVFRGDQRHSYHNESISTVAIAYSVVLYAPTIP